MGGIFLTLLYLFSFIALDHNWLTLITLIVFIIFYVVMSIVFAKHFSDNGGYDKPHEIHYIKRKLRHIDEKQVPARQIEKKKSLLHRIFRKDHAHDAQFKRGIEPLHEVDDDSQAEQHFAKKGMEPIPELHPDIEVYELEQELKSIEARAKKKK